MSSIMDVDYLSFPAMLIYLATYYLVEKAIKRVYRHVNPAFYEQLYRERKDLQYIAFIMRLLIKFFSTPVCFAAFRDSSEMNDTFGAPHRPVAGKVCLASMGVLWTSELIRLDHINGYIVHHLSSLSYLVTHYATDFPHRPLYLFFASTITELVTDSDCLLRFHGVTPKTSALSHKIQYVRLILLITVRFPPCLYILSFGFLHPIQSPIFWLHAIMFCSYTAFIINNIVKVTTRLQVVRMAGEKPKQLQVFQRYRISLYSMFLGCGAFSTAILASALYYNSFSLKIGPVQA